MTHETALTPARPPIETFSTLLSLVRSACGGPLDRIVSTPIQAHQLRDQPNEASAGHRLLQDQPESHDRGHHPMTPAVSRRIIVLGGTGYLGSRLIPLLLGRGHSVTAIIRSESRKKAPVGCEIVEGDPFDPTSLQSYFKTGDTVVQLIGVPKPAPWKGPQFRAIDLVSGLASINAAKRARVEHFVYVSVAQPAPIMKDYIAVRAECEVALRDSGLPATILRPWYVLGPGHWWPLLLNPVYWCWERWPRTRASAIRLGLVTIHEMLETLVWAVEHPSNRLIVMDVADIRSIGTGLYGNPSPES